MKRYFNWLAAALSLLLIESAAAICLPYTPYDDTYFIVCGAFNFAHVFILSFFGTSRIVRDMQALALISLCLQFFGFISYHCRIDISLYNDAIHIVVLIQILRLFIKRKGEPRGMGAFYSWLPNFNRIVFRRNQINFEGKK